MFAGFAKRVVFRRLAQCIVGIVFFGLRYGAAKDAIIFSAHKFPGGPQASGVMAFRDSVVRRDTPTLPGGGSARVGLPSRTVTSQST